MLKRTLLTLLFVGWLLPNTASASDSHSVIVTLKDGAGIEDIAEDYDAEILGQIADRPVFLIHIEEDDVRKLAHDGRVVRAEGDQRISLDDYPKAHSVDESLMRYAAYSWEEFHGTQVLKDYMDQEALHLVDADDVHDITRGAGTRIAFIDTGVDPDHHVLRPWVRDGVDMLGTGSTSEFGGLSWSVMSLFEDVLRLFKQRGSLDWSVMSLFWQELRKLDLDWSVMSLFWSVMSLFSDDVAIGDGLPPKFGHGTLVAGLLHAVAPEASLVPIRTFDVYGNSTVFLATAAVYAAVDLEVDVINMSFSIGQDSMVFREAMDYAEASGIVLVASVGNDSRDAGNVYPAAYSNVLGVAATHNKDDYLASFSNYGDTVTVLAPGRDVVSTFPGGLYAVASGTSSSAPIVSGAVALLMSMGDGAAKAAEKIAVTSNSIDDDNPEFRGMLGHGRINLGYALDVQKAEDLISARRSTLDR